MDKITYKELILFFEDWKNQAALGFYEYPENWAKECADHFCDYFAVLELKRFTEKNTDELGTIETTTCEIEEGVNGR